MSTPQPDRNIPTPELTCARDLFSDMSDDYHAKMADVIASYFSPLRTSLAVAESKFETEREVCDLLRSDVANLRRENTALLADLEVVRAQNIKLKTHLIFQSDTLKNPTDVYEMIRREDLAQLRSNLAAAIKAAMEAAK